MTYLDGADFILNYPSKELDELVDVLIPQGVHELVLRGQRLKLRNGEAKSCYIVKSGYFSYRSFSNGYVISYVYPGMVVGIGNFFWENSLGFFHAEENLEIIRIDEKKFNLTMQDNPHLWRCVATILSYIAQRSLMHNANIDVKNAYSIVKSLLLILNNQPEHVKSKIPVVQFILERVPLSRSRVFNILSELHKGNYISLNRGLLVEMKKLPEKY